MKCIYCGTKPINSTTNPDLKVCSCYMLHKKNDEYTQNFKTRFIPNWINKNLKCHFCGDTKSVKYEMKLANTESPGNFISVPVCNRCILFHDYSILETEGLEED